MAAGLFGSAQKSDEDDATARRVAEVRGKRSAHEHALNAFHQPAPPVPPQRPSEHVLGGPGLAAIEAQQRATKTEAKKYESILIDRRVEALNLPTPQAALLSLAVKADERERGASLIQITRSDAADALGLPVDEAEAALGALRARGLIRFCDSGSGDKGFRVHLPATPY